MITPLYICLGVLVLVGVIVLIVMPFTRRKRLWFVGEGSTLSARLEEQKELILRELKDLEAAYQTGKISKADYDRLSADAFERAREATLALDRLNARQLDLHVELDEKLARRGVLPSGKGIA